MLYLKEIRQQKKLTQADVASFLKIARASYANIENGNRDPDTSTILALADFFSVSTDEIFGRAYNTEKEQYSKEELQLIDWYRSLNDAGKSLVRQTAYTAYASNIYKNNGDTPALEDKIG